MIFFLKFCFLGEELPARASEHFNTIPLQPDPPGRDWSHATGGHWTKRRLSFENTAEEAAGVWRVAHTEWRKARRQQAVQLAIICRDLTSCSACWRPRQILNSITFI